MLHVVPKNSVHPAGVLVIARNVLLTQMILGKNGHLPEDCLTVKKCDWQCLINCGTFAFYLKTDIISKKGFWERNKYFINLNL